MVTEPAVDVHQQSITRDCSRTLSVFEKIGDSNDVRAVIGGGFCGGALVQMTGGGHQGNKKHQLRIVER